MAAVTGSAITDVRTRMINCSKWHIVEGPFALRGGSAVVDYSLVASARFLDMGVEMMVRSTIWLHRA